MNAHTLRQALAGLLLTQERRPARNPVAGTILRFLGMDPDEAMPQVAIIDVAPHALNIPEYGEMFLQPKEWLSENTNLTPTPSPEPTPHTCEVSLSRQERRVMKELKKGWQAPRMLGHFISGQILMASASMVAQLSVVHTLLGTNTLLSHAPSALLFSAGIACLSKGFFIGVMADKCLGPVFGNQSRDARENLVHSVVNSIPGRKNRSLQAVYNTMGTEHAMTCLRLDSLMKTSKAEISPEVGAYITHVGKVLLDAARQKEGDLPKKDSVPDAAMREAATLVGRMRPQALTAPMESVHLGYEQEHGQRQKMVMVEDGAGDSTLMALLSAPTPTPTPRETVIPAVREGKRRE